MIKKTLNNIWKEYKRTNKKELRDKLIKEYLHLPKYIAGRMAISLPDHIEYDDLLSCAVMGLINAIEHYDPERGVPFEYFASHRIKGEILDDLRRMDWVPRSIRKKAKNLETALMKLQNKLGRAPSDKELANYLGITETQLNQLYNEVKGVNLISLQDLVYDNDIHSTELSNFIKDDSIPDPDTDLEKKELSEELANFINTLNNKEKLVIALYYYEGLTLKEIGKVLDITESRVSQLHTKALMNLKAKIKLLEKKRIH